MHQNQPAAPVAYFLGEPRDLNEVNEGCPENLEHIGKRYQPQKSNMLQTDAAFFEPILGHSRG